MPFPRLGNVLSRQSSALLLVAAAIWTLDCIGSIEVFDGAIYDACLSGLSIAAEEEPQVALVYVDEPTRLNPPALSRILSVVGNAKPKGIALTFVPPAEFRRDLSDVKPWVILPTDYVLDPADLGLVSLGDHDAGGDICILALDCGRDGIHRWHSSHVEIQKQAVATLETKIARRVGPAVSIPERFRIFFLGGPGSLPFVDAERLASDSAASELLRNRVVLIGSVPKSPQDAVPGPLGYAAQRMSPLEFHGHVTHTLLAKRPVLDLPAAWRLVLMVGIALALVVWHERRKVGAGLYQLLGLSFFTLLVAAITLGWADLWIRPASILLLQLGSCLLLWERRSVDLQRDVRSFGVDLVGCARRHAWPVRFAASDNPWDHVAEMIDQLLSPSRLVLMRSTPGSMYVREVSAVGCTFKDIAERRRDYRREPYSTALAEGRPIPVHETRALLSPAEDQRQYLTPLEFRGQLFGFCVVGVDPAIADVDRFVDDLWTVAQQAAEMFHRHAELSNSNRRSDRANREDSTGVDRTLDDMSAAVRQLMGRIMRLEDIFIAATGPCLVFDLYGHVLITNNRMSELLDAERVGSMRNASLPLLAELAGEDVETVRGWVRRIAVRRSAETFPIELPTSGQAYLLTLTPVSAPAVGQLVDDVYPFQLVGIRADLQTTIPWSALDTLQQESADESAATELVGEN